MDSRVRLESVSKVETVATCDWLRIEKITYMDGRGVARCPLDGAAQSAPHEAVRHEGAARVGRQRVEPAPAGRRRSHTSAVASLPAEASADRPIATSSDIRPGAGPVRRIAGECGRRRVAP